MKILTFSILIFTVSAFAQQNVSTSILELEQKVKYSSSQSPEHSYSYSKKLTREKKSPGLAILYSFLLPGMGELYAGDYSSGKYFTIAEGVLVATCIGMNIHAGNLKDNYKSFAAAKASVNTSGKDDTYFTAIGNYMSIDQYNDQKALYREFELMYNSDFYYWKWQNEKDRKTYRSMWSSSEQTYNDIRFVVGAMILNRVASAINAVRLVSAYNSNLEEDISWNISMDLKNEMNLPTSINLNFQTSF